MMIPCKKRKWKLWWDLQFEIYGRHAIEDDVCKEKYVFDFEAMNNNKLNFGTDYWSNPWRKRNPWWVLKSLYEICLSLKWSVYISACVCVFVVVRIVFVVAGQIGR